MYFSPEVPDDLYFVRIDTPRYIYNKSSLHIEKFEGYEILQSFAFNESSKITYQVNQLQSRSIDHLGLANTTFQSIQIQYKDKIVSNERFIGSSYQLSIQFDFNELYQIDNY